MHHIYALIEQGRYVEEYHVNIIKINKNDKDKFIKFCEDTKGFNWDEEMNIIAFMDNVELFQKDFGVDSIKEIIGGIKSDLDFINEMKEEHCNYKRKDRIEKLLDYDFI